MLGIFVPAFIYLIFFTSFIYQFLPRLPPWNYCTSWFSSFNIYYDCAVVVAVVIRFLALTIVIPLVLVLSAIRKNLRQVFFFQGLMALRPTEQLCELLLFLVNLHQKEILTQRAHFSRYGADCPNNSLCCLYEVVQSYYFQD